MITAIVNIDLYRYEIHSLLKAFFPQEDVKVLTKADAEGNRKYREGSVPVGRVCPGRSCIVLLRRV